MDRPEIQYTAKEIARAMANPTEAAWTALKRCVRYLIGKPRMVTVYRRQRPTNGIMGMSDSDWAGCTKQRKSSSCMLVMHGRHLLVASSSTQQVVALSSAEAEYYALVKCASRTLGVLAMAVDLGFPNLRGIIKTDSSGAKGIAQRRGAGRVRHIECHTLWLQDQLFRKKLKLFKVDGKTNPADVGTKYLTAADYDRILTDLGIEQRSGRSKLALRAAI